MKVFLGGTCNDSQWRDRIKPRLKLMDIEYFDPVVDDWDDKAQQRELEERERCDILLYTITPKMQGVYSIAEVVDDSNKRPEKTVLMIRKIDDNEEFTEGQLKSLNAVAELVKRNGAQAFSNCNQLLKWLRYRNEQS